MQNEVSHAQVVERRAVLVRLRATAIEIDTGQSHRALVRRVRSAAANTSMTMATGRILWAIIDISF